VTPLAARSCSKDVDGTLAVLGAEIAIAIEKQIAVVVKGKK
jgi:hypothetical protein